MSISSKTVGSCPGDLTFPLTPDYPDSAARHFSFLYISKDQQQFLTFTLWAVRCAAGQRDLGTAPSQVACCSHMMP